MNKAGMVRTNKSPADPENNQDKNAVPDSRMEFHRITANLHGHEAQNNANNQEPMKQANRQIPDANNFFHS